MAAVIRGSTAATQTNSPSSPSSTAVGDLVLVVHWTRGAAGVPTHTLQSGFTEIRSHSHDDGSTDGRLSVAYKIATSAGANAYNAYTSDTGTDFAGIVVLEAGTFDDAQIGDAQNSVTQTNNAAPNPPSITTPVADCLVLAIAAWYLASAATVAVTAPTNYTEVWEMAGSNTAELSVASRVVATATTEDPAAFGDDVAPSGTASMTIAFRPAVSTSPITGTSDGVATASATLTGRGALSGSSAGVAAPSATLVGEGALSGTTPGVATTSGALTGKGALTGSSAGVATVTGSMAGGAIDGSTAGSSTVSGALAGKGALSGSVAASSSAAGAAAGKGALAGSSLAAAVVSGAIAGKGALAGAANALATVAGQLRAQASQISGSTSAGAAVAGVLRGVANLVGAVAAGAAAIAALTGRGALAGSSAGSSTATLSATPAEDPAIVIATHACPIFPLIVEARATMRPIVVAQVRAEMV